MRTIQSLFLYSFLLILFLFLNQQIAVAGVLDSTFNSPTAAPLPASNDTEFIRTSCATTLYADLCFTSLSGYASKVQSDPARLAKVAIDLSLTKAKRMANYVSNLCRQSEYGSDPRAAAALHDCFTVFGDAVDQIRGSMKQMRKLGGTNQSLRFQVSNVQTYMSAALTNEDTCTDGFQEVVTGPVKADVCDRVVIVRQVTSNALALVNNFAKKLIPN